MPELWDIFCRVIDNFGDVGVCWRLASQIAARGKQVRFWLDDPGALAWMAPEHRQLEPHLQVLPWQEVQHHVAGDVVIEAFGCEISPEFVARSTYLTGTDVHFHLKTFPVWLNLEYLSAERFAQACHGLPSPVMSGPCVGMTKWFFYPGFTPNSGGLLREPQLRERLDTADEGEVRARHGIPARGPVEVLVTLFCYEPPSLAGWLTAMAEGSAFPGTPNVRLAVAPGRPADAVRTALAHQLKSNLPDQNRCLSWNNQHSLLHISYLEPCAQAEFDELLAVADFNCVRGEDSLVRALWAGKPLLWQIYPQDDGAHHPKLAAWLDVVQASAEVRQLHAAWNSAKAQPMPPIDLAAWQSWADATSQRLLAQSSLVDRLLAFVQTKQCPSKNP